MSYGDGSITEVKRPDGRSYSPKRWRVCVSYTVDKPQPDGTVKRRRKKVQRNVTGTKAQAKEERDRIVAERDENGRPLSSVEIQKAETENAEAMTLARMVDLWDAARRTSAKASEKTMRDGRSRLRLVEAQIGELPLASIRPQDVEAAYAAIREERGLCGTTLRHIHTLLKNVFEKAVDYDLIAKNPCSRVDAPRRSDP